MPRHGLSAMGAERSSAMPPVAGRGLATWPIRRKLVALVAVPVIVIIAAGAWMTSNSVTGLRRAERTRSLATVAQATNAATVALDNELSLTLTYLQRRTQSAKEALVRQRTATDTSVASLKDQLGQAPAGGWSGDVMMWSSALDRTTARLPDIRSGTDNGHAQMVVYTTYGPVFSALRKLTESLARDIATSSGDGSTVDQAATLSALAVAASAANEERATGTIALHEKRNSPKTWANLQKLVAQQEDQLSIAKSHATTAQQGQIDEATADSTQINNFRASLADLAAGGRSQSNPEVFANATGQRVNNLDALVGKIAKETHDLAAGSVRGALIGTIAIAGLTVVTLLLVFATLAAIARTVTGPMRRLRSGAVEVATVRLPSAVRQIEQQGIDAQIDLPPVMPPGTVAGPETLEVAHAVDGLTAEAVRLATAQVRLRHALDEAFVSMSRRSQTMVEKQLAIIDELESTEEDPEQLRNLFRLDHLAARMRRYNDNLLVLAGSSVRTRSNTPVPVSDVFRAATSEMEQYERVRLQPVSNAAVAGPVAGGLIHLLAELLDNAAMYSPPTSPILLTAAFTPGGGLHLEVTDSGVGIPPAELAELNARLAAPGTIDTQIPSRMGLFVVGRLAQRGGFEVRLSPRATAAGTVAEVLVPATHVVGAPSGPSSERRSPTPDFSPMSRPAEAPPAVMPPAARQPSPSLPQRPTIGWPPAEPQAPPQPAEAAPGAAGGALPSRVPGAALSKGPLASRTPTPPPSSSPFDAFGGTSAPAVHRDEAGRTASATAAWSPAARAARSSSSSFPPSDLSGGPYGDEQESTAPPTGALPIRPLGGPGAAGEQGFDRGPFGGTSPAGGSGESRLPSRPARGADPFGTAALFGVTPPDPASAAGLFTPSAPNAPETSGIMLPVERVAPITGELPAGELRFARGRGGADALGNGGTASSTWNGTSALDDPALPTDRPADGDRGYGDRAADGGRRPEADRLLGGDSAPAAGAATRYDALPTESEARKASQGRYTPANPDAPVIGNLEEVATGQARTPIFDQISVWFHDQEKPAETTPLDAPEARPGAYEPAPAPWPGSLTPGPTGAAEDTDLNILDDQTEPDGTLTSFTSRHLGTAGGGTGEESRQGDLEQVPAAAAGRVPLQDAARLLDLRDTSPAGASATPTGSGANLANRWASLGDQQWLAASARAASAPEVAGDTDAGLPRRRPGANLLPSASSAAPASAPAAAAPPFHRADADAVRGRLGSYQAGVSSARRSRHLPTSGTAASLFTTTRATESDPGREPDDQGGEQ